MSIIAAAGAALLVPLVLFLHTFSPAPLPAPKPYAGTLPIATPPKDMAVFALVAGVNHRVAAFGYRGGLGHANAVVKLPYAAPFSCLPGLDYSPK